jgi:hypothetical protein
MTGPPAGPEPVEGPHSFKSLFKIWNFGVVNAKILPCRLEKSPKIGIFSVY